MGLVLFMMNLRISMVGQDTVLESQVVRSITDQKL